MSYITKNRDTMFKDERNKITLNKDMFAFASDFNDVYFANDLNWKKLAIHFRHAGSNQTKIIVLMEDSNEGWFEASGLARTGSWQIEKIQVHDKDGDMDTVLRSGMPSPANFDIVTTTKIAPSEAISFVTDATHLALGAGKAALYEVGFKVIIWDDVANAQHGSTLFTITEIVGDVLTLDQAVTSYAGKTLRLRFPAYNQSSPRQKSIYQYVGVTFE